MNNSKTDKIQFVIVATKHKRTLALESKLLTSLAQASACAF